MAPPLKYVTFNQTLWGFSKFAPLTRGRMLPIILLSLQLPNLLPFSFQFPVHLVNPLQYHGVPAPECISLLLLPKSYRQQHQHIERKYDQQQQGTDSVGNDSPIGDQACAHKIP